MGRGDPTPDEKMVEEEVRVNPDPRWLGAGTGTY